MLNFHTNQNGFTLIELTVYIFIFAIILGAFMTLLYNFGFSNEKTESEIAVSDSAHVLSTLITRIVRGGTDIIFPPGSQPFDRLMLWNDSTLYRIDVEDGVARLKIGSGGEVPITTNDVTIDSLTFRRYEFSNEVEFLIRVEATIVSTNPAEPASQSIDFWVANR